MKWNEAIGRYMEVKPEIEYCVGTETSICYSPKNVGFDWPAQQKQECERWLAENQEYAKKNGYGVEKMEWWPSYNQSIEALFPVLQKIASTKGNIVEMKVVDRGEKLYVSVSVVGEYYQSGKGKPVDQMYTAVIAYLKRFPDGN